MQKVVVIGTIISVLFFCHIHVPRNFRLLLEQHKRLFSGNAEFHILSAESDQSSRYDARTFYTGTIEGNHELLKVIMKD